MVILKICLFYGFIYNTFLKYKKKNYQYFVTNKRIALFNPEKGFRIENISDIEHVSIAREKDNYGDVTFNFYSNSFYEQLTNWMSFEGVENPRKIVELISLLNKNVNFYDDRPVWIQGIDVDNDIAKVGFIDNFEEKDVYIEDLYEKNLFN